MVSVAIGVSIVQEAGGIRTVRSYYTQVTYWTYPLPYEMHQILCQKPNALFILASACQFSNSGNRVTKLPHSHLYSRYGSIGFFIPPPSEIDLAGICMFLSAVIVLVYMALDLFSTWLLYDLAPLFLSHIINVCV